MAKLIDFKCRYAEYTGISPEITEPLGLTLPDAFLNGEALAKLAIAMRDANKLPICVLPLDPVLEAENIGAKIKLDDSSLGPRSDEYIISSIEQIAQLPVIDPDKGRMAETLRAVKLINDSGESATVEIYGPITIVNSLMDLMQFLISWRKNGDILSKFFNNISLGLQNYALAAYNAGSKIIYYADSPGSLNILGPKYTKDMVREFTLPFLKSLDEKLDDSCVIHLCPKTSFVLTGTENAVWESLALPEPMTYMEGCQYASGKVRFLGQRCRKDTNIKVKSINYLKLL